MTPSSALGIEDAFKGRRILITGNTGFKGSWLTLWLSSASASVAGYSLPAPTEPNLFGVIRGGCSVQQHDGDVRDLESLRRVLAEVKPDVIFHLAAQPLVRRSYLDPVGTADTNFLGTINVLEAVRLERLRVGIVIVTSDKCYENREWPFAYRETDRLGGHDVYAMSKAAAELAVDSYRRSFFDTDNLSSHGVLVATVRAGNVIGGGDWAEDRIVADLARAVSSDQPVTVRNPSAIRPWQHVLEPLSGYLLVAMGMIGHGQKPPAFYGSAWNFGPPRTDCRTVIELVDSFLKAWGNGSHKLAAPELQPHEAQTLLVSAEKAQALLGWRARWSFEETVRRTAEWYKAFYAGESPADLTSRCERQIADYCRETV